ncbi:aprataxin-like protein [Lithohypha guttulata]|nr:aprataxin-like protein [Lithohypha guttulata]
MTSSHGSPSKCEDNKQQESRLNIDVPMTSQLNPNATESPRSLKRSAFAELMAPKPKQSKIASQIENNKSTPSNGPLMSLPPNLHAYQNGLLPYVHQPESCTPGTIVRTTENTVLIRDAFPKGLVHLLLIPRDPEWYVLTPFEAFSPASTERQKLDKHMAFLQLIREEAGSAANLAASELSRLVSPHSTSCKARHDALEGDDPPATLPEGRDFRSEIKIGVHAQPSMATLHIHIMSGENHSDKLKNKKHYNSFNTNFFIPLDDFPLMEDDNLMDKVEQDSLVKGDMKCWRCGKNFGNKFKQLKEHLEDEYNAWRSI